MVYVARVDLIFLFASICNSPEPVALVAEAEQSIREHPLATLFAAVHYDGEGKEVPRSGRGGFGAEKGSAVRRRTAEGGAIRRNLIATAQIEVARQTVMARHFLPEETLAALLQHSPFVPPELIATLQPCLSALLPGRFRERRLHPDAARRELAPACPQSPRPRCHHVRRCDANAAEPHHLPAVRADARRTGRCLHQADHDRHRERVSQSAWPASPALHRPSPGPRRHPLRTRCRLRMLADIPAVSAAPLSLPGSAPGARFINHLRPLTVRSSV